MIDFSKIANARKVLIESMPAPEQCPNGTILGQYSLWLPGNLRAIVKKYQVDYLGMWDTQTAFTRAYLQSLGARRYREDQLSMFYRSSPPGYCTPFRSKTDFLYVDIRSAYPSIYSYLDWHVEYMRGRYLMLGSGPTMSWPFPMSWKSGRSYVVTGCQPFSRILYVHNGGVLQRYDRGKYANPQLVACVWDVLSAIARVAIDRYAARYVLLDGAILPVRTAYEYLDFLESLGLNGHIKAAGHCEVRHAGAWRFDGGESTELYDNARVVGHNGISVTLAEADWILARWRKVVESQVSTVSRRVAA